MERSATAAEIKKSFRRLALEYHPDRNSAPEAEIRFKLINEAYAVLSDPEQRQRYDRYGRSESVRDPFQGGMNAHDLRDIFGDEIFDNLFSSLFGGRRSPARPSDVKATLELTLDIVETGGTREVSVIRKMRCAQCDGLGRSGGVIQRCGRCRGSGQVRMSRGFLTIAQVCPDCGGSGADPQSACRPCGGSGLQTGESAVRVQVPKGVESGHLLRVRGAGHAAKDSGQASDLIVEIIVLPHERFEREGQDLTCSVEVPYDVLVLGGKVDVPLLDGGIAHVKIPAGTQPSQALRLKKKGLPSIEAGGQHGDLFVYVEAYVPKAVSAAERELLVALRAHRTEEHGTLHPSSSARSQNDQPSAMGSSIKKFFGRIFSSTG